MNASDNIYADAIARARQTLEGVDRHGSVALYVAHGEDPRLALKRIRNFVCGSMDANNRAALAFAVTAAGAAVILRGREICVSVRHGAEVKGRSVALRAGRRPIAAVRPEPRGRRTGGGSAAPLPGKVE
jgi:hypothetical protein